MSLALAGGFLATEPPGKFLYDLLEGRDDEHLLKVLYCYNLILIILLFNVNNCFQLISSVSINFLREERTNAC